MAYFNNAFRKTIVVSSYVNPVPADPGAEPPVAASAATVALTPGQVSLYNSKTWAPIAPLTDECEFIIAAGSPYSSDKIGPFHGGYQETIKSKGINPKYVSKVWDSPGKGAQPFVLNIGTTIATLEGSVADCCPTFLCGEQYHLRVDVKGEAVLRMLNHQGYIEVTADGGCCPDSPDDPLIAPVAVDPYSIMKQWAEGIWRSAVVTGNGPNFNGASTSPASERFNENPFIVPVIQITNAGGTAIETLVYPPGTSTLVLDAAAEIVGEENVFTWDEYVSDWDATTDVAQCAGLTLQTAYIETTFGDCTFQPSDYYGKEPIRIYASEVDLNGDPCEFTGICIDVECPGRQPQGLGETVLRDFILSESYRQNHFATDLRIREITQGNDMLTDNAAANPGKVQRTALYDRLMILHTVPRFNNPSGTFDNDQYLVELVAATNDAVAVAALAALREDLLEVLDNVNNDACVVEAADDAGECAEPSVPVTV